MPRPAFRRALLARLTSHAFCITALAVPALTLPQAAHSQTAARTYSIPGGPLEEALNRFGREASILLAYPADLTAGLRSPGLEGQHTVESGLAALLRGTGLQALPQPNGSYLLRRAAAAATGSATLPQVTVTANAESSGLYAGGQVARGGRVGLLGNRSNLDTPFSTTQYTAQLVEDQQAQNIGDVLVNDPSVRNTYARGAGRDEFNIRGFTLFNYDVSFNGLYGVSPRNATSLIGVERVEVLRGPNSLLNGMAPAGSVGGGINLLPKRAGAEPLNRFTLSYIDDSQLGAHADLSRRFGADKEWGARINVMKRSGDTPVQGSKERLDALALGVDYQGERVRLEADINYQDRLTNARSGLLFPPSAGVAIPAAPDNKLNFQPSWSFWSAKELSTVLRAGYDISPDLTAFAAIGAMKYDFQSLATTSQLLDSLGGMRARPTHLKEYVDTRTAEAGLRGKFKTGSMQHEPVVSVTSYSLEQGLSRLNGVFSNFNLYAPTTIAQPNLPLAPDIPKTGETNLRSVALVDTISSGDQRIQVTLGARHQRVETINLSVVPSVRYNESTVTPLAAVLFKATNALSFYGNYIEGLGQGATAPAGTQNAGEMFPPSKSKQAEVGVKFDAGRFATTASLFQIVRPSGFSTPSLPLPVYRIDGRQRNRGLEILSQGEIASGVRLLTGLAYTEGKLVRTENGTNDGRTAPATPRLQFNVSGEWDTPSVPGLTLTARALQTSSQFVDTGNTQKLPSWTRWDLGARYRFKSDNVPITLRAALENVLDRNYWQSAAREGLTIGAPRTLLVSVSADF